MVFKLKEYASEDYQILLSMYEHQIKIKGEDIVPMTQNDLCAECGLSKPTVNRAVQSLVKSECVEQLSKGRYKITLKGNYIVEAFEKKITIEEREDNADGKS